MQAHLFCFGLGYSAAALGRRLMERGWRVSGTTRSEPRADELRKAGFAAHLFSDDHPLPDLKAAMGDARYVLISTPPGPDGSPELAAHRAQLAALAPDWRWLGYLSTTGVYGDRGGDWVDERAPPAPTTERGKRRAMAEAAWANFAQETGAPLHIFRLAGIYGPGRSALEQLSRGQARRIDKPGHVFSRIHVTDLARVLEASMTKPNPGAIYNVCDDEAAPGHAVLAYAAGLLGMEPPPLEPFDVAAATMSPMARSFYAESKRVKNDRIKQELGVALKFPTYREGLTDIDKHMGHKRMGQL
jgi:nucleoside-diphosphate-sugar epimerase